MKFGSSLAVPNNWFVAIFLKRQRIFTTLNQLTKTTFLVTPATAPRMPGIMNY